MNFFKTVDTWGNPEVLTQSFQNEKLSIRVYTNGFSYGLYQENQLLWLEQLEFTNTPSSFEKIIEFLKHKFSTGFKTVECISDSESYAVLPQNAGSDFEIECFFVRNISSPVQFFEIEKYALDQYSNIVYELRSGLKKTFKTAYPQIVFQNSLIRVLENIQSSGKIKEYGAVLNFSDASAGFVLLYNEKLQAIRNFDITRKEDFLYHFLYVFHQLQVPTHQTILFISGLID